jgi:hypothetical protein
MADSFVNTLKRDYVSQVDRSSADIVLQQMPAVCKLSDGGGSSWKALQPGGRLWRMKNCWPNGKVEKLHLGVPIGDLDPCAGCGAQTVSSRN